MGQLGLLFVAGGILLVCGGAFQWDWFRNDRKVKNDHALFGPELSRVTYIALGVGLMGIGVLAYLGVVQ